MRQERGRPPGDLTVPAGGAFVRQGEGQATGSLSYITLASGVQNGVYHPKAL